MKPMHLVVVILCLFLRSLCLAAEQPTQGWQVVLEYNAEGVRVVAADPIAPSEKPLRTPGLMGAPARVAYRADWLDAGGRTLSTTETQVPLGRRSPPDPDAPLPSILPGEGATLIRLLGPAVADDPTRTSSVQQPAALRLTRLDIERLATTPAALPDAFDPSIIEMPLPKPGPGRLDGPIANVKVVDNGANTKRLVFVVLGDGYTSADLATGSFTAATQRFVNAYSTMSPWKEYFSFVNIYRVDTVSNESGADGDPTRETVRDTYYNCGFWVGGLDRLLAVQGIGFSRCYAAADAAAGVGVWDEIVVLVNSNKAGGSGGYFSVASTGPPNAVEGVTHETGHSFAGLADEYDYGNTARASTDGEANVDFDFQRALVKWNLWIEPNTPLPTPPTAPYLTNTIGAFEGAKYYPYGMYRPRYHCWMRGGQTDGFCPICKETHIIELHKITPMVDSSTPAQFAWIDVGHAGATVTTYGANISSFNYEWKIDQAIVSGANGRSITITPNQMRRATQVLNLRISDTTPLVRQKSFIENFSWNLRRAVPSESDTMTVR